MKFPCCAVDVGRPGAGQPAGPGIKRNGEWLGSKPLLVRNQAKLAGPGADDIVARFRMRTAARERSV